MMVSLTDEQNAVKGKLLKWFADNYGRRSECSLAGYAGTGKTTLLTHLAAELHRHSIGFLAPTGKAAFVLRKKLTDAGVLNKSSSVSTIHSYRYNCLGTDDEGNLIFVDKETGDMIEHDLLIVDEASMIQTKLHEDLLSLNKPILYVGDPWQLPPVKSEAFLPLEKTDLILKTVHRQALNNPIVLYATKLREGESIKYGNYDNAFIYRHVPVTKSLRLMYSQVNKLDIGFLCSKNTQRKRVNSDVRAVLGFRNDLPQAGEQLICLRNDKDLNLFNGMQVTIGDVSYIDDKFFSVWLIKQNCGSVISYTGVMGLENPIKELSAVYERDKQLINAIRRKFSLGKYWKPYHFDYGYAMTIHKSQGSEWDNVAVFAESIGSNQPLEEYKRMIYTAMTRARNKLYLFNMEGTNRLC